MILNGKLINPGELRTRITLKRRSVAMDSGFLRPVPVVLGVVWSKWTNAHGAEVWEAESIQAEAPATVLIRYRADIDATCLVEKNGQDYEIVGTPDDIEERHEWQEMKVRRLRSG